MIILYYYLGGMAITSCIIYVCINIAKLTLPRKDVFSINNKKSLIKLILAILFFPIFWLIIILNEISVNIANRLR